MKSLLLFFILSLSVSAHAITWAQAFDNYFAKIYTNTLNSPVSCESTYAPLTKDGVLEIRYAFGYFDASEGNNLNNQTPEAFSRSLDKGAANSVEWFLKRPCRNTYHQLCGFKKLEGADGYAILEKTILQFGRRLTVRLSLTHASATNSFFDNTGVAAAQQELFTARSEQNYFGGVKDGADIVYYVGHSRNGGGPDFQPPVLRDYDGHPDYDNYYEVRREGEASLLSALKESPNKEQIIGLFSCYSSSHFRNNLLSANAGLKMILSHVSIPYNEAIYASLGYLEGSLRGVCGEALETLAEQTPMTQKGFSSGYF